MDFGTLLAHTLLFFVFYFEVFLLVSFIERQRNKTQDTNATSPQYFPSVCIVVPCFNEERTLALTINSLLSLEYPKEKLEVLIVNDGSTDTTQTVAERYTHYPHIKVFKKENGGKHTALNLALTHTKSELIGCLDADSTVKEDALIRLVSVFENFRVAAITPGIHVHIPPPWIQYIPNI